MNILPGHDPSFQWSVFMLKGIWYEQVWLVIIVAVCGRSRSLVFHKA